MALTFDRSILGQEFDHTVFEPVTKEDMLAYATAYGETNPIYLDEAAARSGPYGTLVAVPTFAFRLRGHHFMPKSLAQVGRAGLDAGKDVEFGEPIRPGDVLTASSTIHDIYEKTGRTGTMHFIVIRTLVTNQNGMRVAVIDQRMMFR